MDDLTCNHRESGLCPECRDDYETDSSAWLEFGCHPAGQARWEEFRREMDAKAAREREAESQRCWAPPADGHDDAIPF